MARQEAFSPADIEGIKGTALFEAAGSAAAGDDVKG
jgi:hypothetical protein